ncbi:nucleoside-diphosphate kinase [Candidatus Gracilibacteria bacterium]|nr:nucleoside-diphosphate kinase [Candidatus Gracilibacteria bacterium]NJS41247.1 nucleoside-diphosphate kinase [Candidatus Gracilibacteria bacterium]
MNHPAIQAIRHEQTYVMMKPDGVKRGLTGEVMSRISKAGLKVVALKMVKATEDQIRAHYPMQDQEWVDGLGEKGLGTFEKLQLDAKEFLGTDNKSEIGRSVAEGLVDYMQSGPVVCMIVEGIGAIEAVRKMVGHTLPFKAEPGTIRGDFSVDSPVVANVEGRAIQNVVHASVVADEAAHEISIWFNEDEVINYKIAGEDIMYGKIY